MNTHWRKGCKAIRLKKLSKSELQGKFLLFFLYSDMPGAQLRSEEASKEAQSKCKPNVALRVKSGGMAKVKSEARQGKHTLEKRGKSDQAGQIS